MVGTYLAIFVPAALLILGALLKVSRQTGRIEEGVKGLYDRVERIEGWIDGQPRFSQRGPTRRT